MWLPATEFGGPARIVARPRSGMDVRRCGQPCCAVLRRCALLLPVVPLAVKAQWCNWPQRSVLGLGSWAASRATNYAFLLACGGLRFGL
jgi:hypothetical protein